MNSINQSFVSKQSFGPNDFIGLRTVDNKRVLCSSNIFYYELYICENDKSVYPCTFEKESIDIIIGLVEKKFQQTLSIGRNKYSFGYSSDGKLRCGSDRVEYEFKKFEEGDVVGCGFNILTNEIFFTLNGECFYSMKVDNKCLYPAITLNKWRCVMFNFGELPFVYTGNNEVKDNKDKEMKNILVKDEVIETKSSESDHTDDEESDDNEIDFDDLDDDDDSGSEFDDQYI